MTLPNKKINFQNLGDANIKRFQNNVIYEWNKISSLRKQVLKKYKPDDIHDLRILLRRFRLSQKLYQHFTVKPHKKKLKESTHQLLQSLGNIRNMDEALLFFAKKPAHVKIRRS